MATQDITQVTPEPGQFVHVRGRRWVVFDILGSSL